MSEKKQKQPEDSQESIVNEPAMTYESATNVETSSYLPDDILVASIHHAQKNLEQGKVIPNSEIYERMSERLGWK